MAPAKPWLSHGTRLAAVGCCLAALVWLTVSPGRADKAVPADLAREYTAHVRPLMVQYCLKCHSTRKKRGDLDLERFGSLDAVRTDVRPWQAVLEMLDTGQMPPRKKPQPAAAERQRLTAWVRGMLAAEAHARAGDPGRVMLRRLSNAEYNNTVRDLTGIDLQPARDFPVDGAAGEGFTNAGDALPISPTLLSKYLNAAKDVAAHAVLLPGGFRFSRAKTPRDRTDEALAELRQFYSRYSGDGKPPPPVTVFYSQSEFYTQSLWDGKLPLRPYLTATVRHRDALAAGRTTPEAVATSEHLNAKYLRTLWQVLSDRRSSFPLDGIRARWRRAGLADVGALVADVAAWQGLLWRFVPIGSYRYGNTIRQLPNNPALAESQALRVQAKPAPGQNEVVIYLSVRDFTPARPPGYVVWHRPRFEGGNGPPLLLRDYNRFGRQFEVDYASLFTDTDRYLAAVLEAVDHRNLAVEKLASRHGLDATLLRHWLDLMDVDALRRSAPAAEYVRKGPAVPLALLDGRLTKSGGRPAINGWVARGSDLPVLITNNSNTTEHVPGRMSPHHVCVHPTPTQFAAAAWKSPLTGRVRVTSRVVHAHPACGNGVVWWLEHRQADEGAVLAEGALGVGGQAAFAPREVKVRKGDLLVLAVDPRDGNHVCDLTEIFLTVTELGGQGRVWDLAHDVADNVLAGNPHPDRFGTPDLWRFVQGPARKPGEVVAGTPPVPAGSVLAAWRAAAADKKRRAELGGLAERVRKLLTGTRPAGHVQPDRVLYDSLVSLDGPLLRGVDLAHVAKAHPAGAARYGLEPARFGRHPPGHQPEAPARPHQPEAPARNSGALARASGWYAPVDAADLVVPSTSVLEVRLPAGLFRDRAFVAEGRLDPAGPDRAVQFQVRATPPRPDAPLDSQAPCVAAKGGEAAREFQDGLDEFRRFFPTFICYARVIPNDETVCLKLFHREDEPLVRLFLDDAARRRLDRLWSELRFISRWPVVENKQLPLFIGFVTQDQPKELLAYFESQREPFRKRALAFEKEEEAAIPRQLDVLAAFAARAYRRPLHAAEKADLTRLYDMLRKRRLSHDEAFRTVLTRVLVSPSFLFRVEQAPPGKEARPVSDWELATRLSYFLWATMPDDELRQAAGTGRLHEPRVLSGQIARMLQDPKVRGLAVEFGTQWLHVRDVRQNHEKNEKLFPTFDDKLRDALFEEAVHFFQDLFQHDRRLPDVIDADYTFLNETLARHYGIPGVTGPEWRRVTGVKRYGRGGILSLAAVLTQQSGASRTSPVLRGNWLLETLLGEKLPKPPPNVPKLPEEETATDATVRQLVEKHARIAECAVCHQRMDPFGFALEKYDPIGRFRDKDLAGRPVDTKVRLKDGTQFDGIDGLRRYLLTQRRQEVERHFCQKLLGYALGRSVTLSDQPLLDEMLEALRRDDYRLSAAVLTIVKSKQFQYHRGLEATKEEETHP
jgi:hypothetical protein